MGGSVERDQDPPRVEVSTDLAPALWSLTAVTEGIAVCVSCAPRDMCTNSSGYRKRVWKPVWEAAYSDNKTKRFSWETLHWPNLLKTHLHL